MKEEVLRGVCLLGAGLPRHILSVENCLYVCQTALGMFRVSKCVFLKMH